MEIPPRGGVVGGGSGEKVGSKTTVTRNGESAFRSFLPSLVAVPLPIPSR